MSATPKRRRRRHRPFPRASAAVKKQQQLADLTCIDSPNSLTTATTETTRALQLTRTSEGIFSANNQGLLVQMTDTGEICPWRPNQPEYIEVKADIEYFEVADTVPLKLIDEDVYQQPANRDLNFSMDVDSSSGEEADEDFSTEQFFEALQGEEDEDAASETTPEEFQWSDDYSTFVGKQEQFLEKCGSSIKSASPLEIFCKIFDQPLIEMIVAESNRYAWQTIARASETGISEHSRINDWEETSVDEIYRLIAAKILMGICFLSSTEEYWSKGILAIPGFRKIMARDRFFIINKFLHFKDNDYITIQGDERKISKISPVLNYLNDKFQAVYKPRRELSLDESLLLWKGKLSFAQTNRSKASRFGIKTYELCEAATGYVLKLEIYTGKESTSSQPIAGFSSSTAKVVLKLMNDYLGKGHSVYMDSFYNSIALSRHLKRHATDVVGTLNRRRLDVPNSIKNLEERKIIRGTIVSAHCGDVSVTAWKDVRLVTTVSTYHNADFSNCQRANKEIVIKPKVIQDYNKFMGGVDLKDQKLSYYLLERKRKHKWYMKVFNRLLNISILNSYIIYCSNMGNCRKMTHKQFRFMLAEELLHVYGLAGVTRLNNSINMKRYTCNRLDKMLDHFPECNEVEHERISNKQCKLKRGRCVRCLAGKIRTMTSITCSECKVYLCVGQCWREYHTIEELTYI